MSMSLIKVLSAQSGGAGIRLWLRSSGYARRLLLGEDGDPWVSAAQYLAFFSQAHSLLQPDVAVVDVGDLYRSWMRRHPELVAAMGAKRRAAFPLRKLLDEEEPRRLLNEVVEAVLSHLRGRTSLVLSLPTPRAWLEEAKAAASLGDIAIDDDSVEDAAMYMADLLRSVSQHPIGGVIFEEDSAAEMTEASLQPYRPLLNIACHYRWATILRGRFTAMIDPASLDGFDAIIADRPTPARETQSIGIDVSDALWRQQNLPPLEPGRFRFVSIPVDGQPEKVLEALASLR